MQAIDWAAPATLTERDDSGSDLHYHFRKLREGALGELVRAVAEMPVAERARLVLEVARRHNIERRRDSRAGATEGSAMSAAKTIADFTANLPNGEEVSLADKQGKVLLVVNTASKCGFTPQYDGLEALWQQI